MPLGENFALRLAADIFAPAVRLTGGAPTPVVGQICMKNASTRTERMEAIKEMTDQVAHAASEQISVSQGVAQHISGIADVAHETEMASRDSASSSDVLAALAATQQQLISRFKV